MFSLLNLQSLFGLVVIVAVCWAISENRRAFPWRLAIGAVLVQAVPSIVRARSRVCLFMPAFSHPGDETGMAMPPPAGSLGDGGGAGIHVEPAPAIEALQRAVAALVVHLAVAVDPVAPVQVGHPAAVRCGRWSTNATNSATTWCPIT